MKCVYLDVCCLNRPFDDQTQRRVRLEAEAVLAILDQIERGALRWISSEVVLGEIDEIRDAARRERLLEIVTLAEGLLEVTAASQLRAVGLTTMGFGANGCPASGLRGIRRGRRVPDFGRSAPETR